jgi:hypothetical protein
MLRPRVKYAVARTSHEREAIFRLRHEAYLREGTILPQSNKQFRDAVDDASNCLIVGTFIDNALAGSIRLSVSMPGAPQIPTAHVFPDVLEPRLAAGETMIDPTRFVADYEASRAFPELPYLTLRLPWMAMTHFQADIMLAAVRPEHQAFYIRLWGNQKLCDPRPYPNLTKPVALTAHRYSEVKDRVHELHPYFRSNAAERDTIFGGREALPPTAGRASSTSPMPAAACWQ